MKRWIMAVCVAAGALMTPGRLPAQAVGGPRWEVTRVAAYGTDRFDPLYFRAGEQAVVTVLGDGVTDLDLYVYDSNGHLVGKDDDRTDQCIVRWVPRWTGRFYIVVVNRGSVSNEYTLLTN